MLKFATLFLSAFFVEAVGRVAVERVFLDVDVLAVVEADVLESFIREAELRRHSVVNSLRQEIGHFGIQTVLKKRKKQLSAAALE